jgi:hypothetical protein
VPRYLAKANGVDAMAVPDRCRKWFATSAPTRGDHECVGEERARFRGPRSGRDFPAACLGTAAFAQGVLQRLSSHDCRSGGAGTTFQTPACFVGPRCPRWSVARHGTGLTRTQPDGGLASSDAIIGREGHWQSRVLRNDLDWSQKSHRIRSLSG